MKPDKGLPDQRIQDSFVTLAPRRKIGSSDEIVK